MNVKLALDRTTIAEKLSAIEALWRHLSANANQFDSPAWHGEFLREREKRIDEGKKLRERRGDQTELRKH